MKISLYSGSVLRSLLAPYHYLNRMTRFPKEKTLNPASFPNVAISFIGFPSFILSYHNFAWNAAKILPVRILPCASTNPESAFFTCPPYKDTARQVSKAYRACPLFYKHRIPVNFRNLISMHRHRASICPPQKIFPCIICFSSHGPPAADSVPPGCFWLPGRPGQKATDSGVPLRHLMALGSCRSGAGANKRGCLAAARRLQTYIFTSALPYSPFPTDIPAGTGRSPLL